MRDIPQARDDQSGAAGALNAELTTPVSSDGTVWHGRERMRLIGKAFFLIDCASLCHCATRFSWHSLVRSSLEQLQPFCAQIVLEQQKTCGIAARARQTFDEA